MLNNAPIDVNETNLELKDLPENLRGDSMRLQQILINLTKNAFKFTKNDSKIGKICKITIFVAFNPEDNFLHICVSDNGKGIIQDELGKIFTKFGKLKRTAEMNSEGIGLGLLISKQLVEVNGGELKAYS